MIKANNTIQMAVLCAAADAEADGHPLELSDNGGDGGWSSPSGAHSDPSSSSLSAELVWRAIRVCAWSSAFAAESRSSRPKFLELFGSD